MTPKCPSHSWAVFYTVVSWAFFKVLDGEYSSRWEMVIGQVGSQMLALFLYRFQLLALPTGQSLLVSDTFQCTLSMSPEGAGSIQVPPHWVLIWSFFPIIERYSGHFLEYSSSICSKFPKSASYWVPGTSRDHFEIVSNHGSAYSLAFCFLMTSHWWQVECWQESFFHLQPKVSYLVRLFLFPSSP